MLKSLVVLLRFFLFWMVYFFVDRLIFLLYFTDKLTGTNFTEIANVFLYSLRIDASMAAYISVIPLLIYLIHWYLPDLTISQKIPQVFVKVLIVLFSLISIFNFNIYREWGSKINFKALDFAFTAPNEAIASSSSSPIFSSLIIFFVLVIISFYLASRIIDYQLPKIKVAIWKKSIAGLFFIALTFLTIRSGWQVSPINQSMAYFSSKPFLNHAAINTQWNLMHDILKNKNGNNNPYNYYPKTEAAQIVKELFIKPNTEPLKVLTTDHPNIVFIIMESFTADIIESLGGEKGVAPNMEKLINRGLFFNNIYAAGARTDKGIVAALSGFPAQAIRSIMGQNDKQEKLPALSQSLAAKGYKTSLYYGGESEFFNLKSYVLSHAYQKLVDEHAFSSEDMNSKWGTYDGKVFQKNIEDLKNTSEPFFSTVITLTNHEPFELPGKLHFQGDKIEDKFRSTSYYTDSCVGAYINDAKKQSWYKNTLFVLVADHGHRLPKNIFENFHPNRYKIPLLFFGDVIKPEFQGVKVSKVGNQTDIAATLLTQLHVNPDKFKWSKDLLNPGTQEFSFFNWDDGFGFVSKDQAVSFDNIGKHIIYQRDTAKNPETKKLLRYGKAYMQQVFQEYLDY